jgi:hypothetical protein
VSLQLCTRAVSHAPKSKLVKLTVAKVPLDGLTCYVGKDDADVFSGFQNGDGLIGIGCLYRSVARRFHQIDRTELTKNFILNDKNVDL